jgi:flagellin
MDMAEETSELTKNNILLQSGTAVLSQANTSNKIALGLLSQGGNG